MDSFTLGLLGIIVMLILMFARMTIGIGMLIIGFIGYAYVVDFTGALGVVKTIIATTSSNANFLVIPLFVLMGQYCFHSGLSNSLYDSGNKWLSRLPGGLAIATIASCSLFASICGSSTATTATFGSVSLPEMQKKGYDSGLATGAIAAGGTLGILIPPSVGFILYGIMTENSIGQLFAAGVIPGIFLTFCYIAAVVIQVKRRPEQAPACQSYSWKERFLSLRDIFPVLILFIIVIGGMFAGMFTATEASAIGAFGSLIYFVFSKQRGWSRFKNALDSTIQTTSMIFLTITGAYVFSYFMAVTKFPMLLSEFVTGLNVNRWIVLVAILILYAILGATMDGLAMIILTVPIFYPIIIGFGFDPIWYGVLMVIMLEMSQITPPVGINLFVMKGIVGDTIPMQTIWRGVVPHIVAIIVALIIMTIFPQISLWLPNILY